MVLFMGLIIPLPFTIKRKMFTFISESPIVAKLQYGMKVSLLCDCEWMTGSNGVLPFQITFIFILILFLDSVNRVYRVQVELASFSKQYGSG